MKSTNRDLESTERGKPCWILPGGNLALMKSEWENVKSCWSSCILCLSACVCGVYEVCELKLSSFRFQDLCPPQPGKRTKRNVWCDDVCSDSVHHHACVCVCELCVCARSPSLSGSSMLWLFPFPSLRRFSSERGRRFLSGNRCNYRRISAQLKHFDWEVVWQFRDTH